MVVLGWDRRLRQGETVYEQHQEIFLDVLGQKKIVYFYVVLKRLLYQRLPESLLTHVQWAKRHQKLKNLRKSPLMIGYFLHRYDQKKLKMWNCKKDLILHQYLK